MMKSLAEMRGFSFKLSSTVAHHKLVRYTLCMAMFDVLNDVVEDVTVAPPEINTFSDLSAIAINFVIGIGFSLSFVALAYSFYMYIISGGNPENTKRAWNAFLWGLIGGAVVLGSVAIRGMVIDAFGVASPQLQDPTPGF